MKKLKLLAPFLTLLAGAVACIVMYRKHYDTMDILLILLCVLLIFYVAGSLIQKQIISFVKQIEEREAKEAQEAEDEGEVIEKELSAQEEEQS